MNDFEVETTSGTAIFDGVCCYEFSRCYLSRDTLGIHHYIKSNRCENDKYIKDNDKRFFYIYCINSNLLGALIQSHLLGEISIPCTYRFTGPILGYTRRFSGLMAAHDAADQRSLEEVNLKVDLTLENLSLSISGVAGHIIEIDCGSKNEQFVKKDFCIILSISTRILPSVVDIRTHANFYEQRFLGTNEPTNIYPKIR